ncbi:MAG TPA: hypothetical protein VIE38_09295 [Gaiellaceae bacterium]
MRLLALAATVALLVAAPASATMLPPPPVPQTLHVLTLSHAPARFSSHSCMARSARVKLARWLAPVACEQPPRSQLLLASTLFGD